QAKITARFPIAIYVYRIAAQKRGNPGRNDRCIGAFRILARTKYIEISEANRLQAKVARKDVSVNFAHELRRGVRGKLLADFVLRFWQIRVIAVDCAAGSENNTLRLCLSRGDQ